MRYDEPLPSREYILDVLNEQGVPVDGGRARAAAASRGRASAALSSARLAAMERDGEIIRNRRDAICVVDKLDLVRGRVQGHPDGFGFLVRDDGGPDLFLGFGEMHKVLHGDRVVARVSGVDRRGRPEGKIVEVLERAQRRVVGRLRSEHGMLFVVPEDKRISHDFLIPPDETPARAAGPGRDGRDHRAAVEARAAGRRAWSRCSATTPIPAWRSRSRCASTICRTCSRARSSGCASCFPTSVTDDRPRGPRRPARAAARDDRRRDREGLRRRGVLRAAQGEARRGKGGYRLVVAIADVSHYVTHGDALDREALRARQLGVFPAPRDPDAAGAALERAVLAQSAGRAAVRGLRHGDRRPTARSTRYKFYPGGHALARAAHLHRSRRRCSRIAQGEAAQRHARARCRISQNLYALFKVLVEVARSSAARSTSRRSRPQIVFDDKGKIERIVPVQRNDAHRLIEECMLAANVCASDFLRKRKQPMLYRVHEGPTPEKLAALREFLKGFGLTLSGGDKPHAKDYAKLLARVKDRPDAQLLQTVMLRSLQQAVYSPDNVGHFGLAYESVHAFHFADPPLSRPARAPRDQGGARSASATSRETGTRWACIAR